MLADPPSRNRQLAAFRKSDGITNLALPQSGTLPMIAGSIELAMRSEKTVEVRRACSDFLIEAAKFYRVPSCKVRVLPARPLRVRELWTTELFGDYDPATLLIRLWMRTAIRKDVSSFGTFLSTLCHEFCHHLGFHLFGFADSWHTRGFYARTAVLYHFARGTERNRLYWRPLAGEPCRIDWQRIQEQQIGLKGHTRKSPLSISNSPR